jgi:NAD-dependent deacetylase
VDPRDCRCPCGYGRFRPDVVWFGESLPHEALDRAIDLARDADMVWVAGTSGVVQPAAILPAIAAHRGAMVVEINPEETPVSAAGAFRLAVPASRGLRDLARLLLDRG